MNKYTLCAAAIALFGASVSVVQAQNAMPGMAMATPDPSRVDYSKINNSVYTFQDLMSAKSRCLSDNSIAAILKISRESGWRFNDVSHRVSTGETLASLAERAGLGYGEIKNVDAEKEEIAAYISAYETMGTMNSRRQSLSKLNAEAARVAHKSM